METEKINKEIRNFINDSIIKKSEIFSKKEEGYWNQFFSALDVIDDTCLAIKEFFKLRKVDFLSLYGLLQVLFIQQDAVNHLEISLFNESIDWKRYPEVKKIRNIRNEVVGHPTKITKKRKKSKYERDEIVFCTLDRSSIDKNGFRYILWKYSGYESIKVNFKEIVQKQDRLLSNELNNILRKLKMEEKKHKEKFKNKKLLKLIEETGFHADHLMYDTPRRGNVLGKVTFNRLKDGYEKVRVGLEERYGSFENITRISGTKTVIDKLDFLFDKIEKKIPKAREDDKDFEVYIDCLILHLKELREHLKEIDKEFS